MDWGARRELKYLLHNSLSKPKKSLRRGWAPPEAHFRRQSKELSPYTLQPTPAKHLSQKKIKARAGPEEPPFRLTLKNGGLSLIAEALNKRG